MRWPVCDRALGLAGRGDHRYHHPSARLLWGAACGHIHQAVSSGNNHAYNTGPILYTDIGVQVVLIIALIVYRRMLGANIMTGTGGRLGVDVGSEKPAAHG